MSNDAQESAEVSESTGHGPFEDAVIHAFGDEISARECLSCGLKVAEGDDGFQLHSCQRIQRFNGKEMATDGGQKVSRLARQETPRLSAYSMKFALKYIGDIEDGLKTVTARLRDEWPDIEASDNLDIFDDEGRFVGHAIVEETEDFPAASASLALNGKEGHHDYEHADDFLDELRGFYPDREIGMDTMVRVIHFSLTDSPSVDDYVDVRKLLDEFVRWECSHCDDGEWMKRTPGGRNGRCPACGYTQGDEFRQEFGIERRAMTDGGTQIQTGRQHQAAWDTAHPIPDFEVPVGWFENGSMENHNRSQMSIRSADWRFHIDIHGVPVTATVDGPYWAVLKRQVGPHESFETEEVYEVTGIEPGGIQDAVYLLVGKAVEMEVDDA